MTTPTEAHYDLRRKVIFSDADEGAQLIADSEARETLELRAALALGPENCDEAYDELRLDCDELRADCDNETKWAAHYLADALAAKARAERAEAAETVALARWNGALERAMKAEADLVALGQCRDDNCRAVVQIDAELAKERARGERIRTALKDAISTYFGADKLVTAERIEAWQAAL